ncbi:arabinofuranosyltransferase [Catenulispora sp. GP43]|uniref:hypothetical protein n=1 Tax=Catenulispora sp. GP43 TaxID=3156263 RepID=UPI003513AD69
MFVQPYCELDTRGSVDFSGSWKALMLLRRIRDRGFIAANLPVLTATVAVIAVILVNSWRYRHTAVDDSLIYDRYFRNFFDGDGLVYNRGQRFNGLTAPFYAYVMLAFGWFFDTPVHEAWVFSTVFMLAAAVLAIQWGRLRGQGLGISLGLCAGFSLPYFYSTYGMETGLFLFLIVACLYLYETKRYQALAIAGALTVLTRGEGSILLVMLVADHLIRRRPLPSWRILIAPALILLTHYTFNWLYYGTFEPATAHAKIWQGQSGLWDDEQFLDARRYMQSWFFEDKSWLWQGLAALAIVGVLVRIRQTLPILAFAVGYSSFFYFLHIPDYFWYYAPLLFLYFCYAGLGITDVASLFGRGLAGARAAGSTQVGAAMAIGTLVTGLALLNLPAQGGGPDRYQSAAKWLVNNVPADSTLAADEIGTLGYYSHLNIVDILGLVNPDNARYIGERHFDAWTDEYHPDYYLVHSTGVGAPMWTMEHGVQKLVEQHKLWVATGFPHLPGLVLYCREGAPACSPI